VTKVAPLDKFTIFYGTRNNNQELGTRFFVQKRNIQEVKRVGLVSNSISYTILRGRWFDIIALNVHAPTVNKLKT
jgi:hypothetical protein